MTDIRRQDLNDLGNALRDAMIAGFQDITTCMDTLDRRIDSIDMRMDAFGHQMDTTEERLDQISTKQDQVLNAIDGLAGQIETLTQEGAAQHHHNHRIDDRFDRIEQHVGLEPFKESLRA